MGKTLSTYFFLLIIACFLPIGIYLGRKGKKQATALEKYRFHNRTDGGVVQYSSFEHAKKAESEGKEAATLRTLGNILAFIGSIGAIFLVGGLVLWLLLARARF